MPGEPSAVPDLSAATAWARRMGMRIPLVNAPMGGVAGGRLAAAVTAAGGLGMIGMGSAGSVRALELELPHLGGVEGPFGIGLVDWVVAREPRLLEVAIEARPALISVSFGENLDWAARVAAAGIASATQVYSGQDARRAQDAGIGVLVARGVEGGGHGAVNAALLPLLDEVLDVASVPVLAAGGIGAPRDLAAVLRAGASGAWLGTCLAACTESLLSDAGRQALLDARGTDTVLTRAYDVGMELPWPARFPARVLRTGFTDRWTGREEELATDRSAKHTLAAALAVDDPKTAPIDAGEGVGMITSVEPAARVLERLWSGVTGPVGS
ncbi:nitronate monooxygenase [Streptomyces gardneri]|uniref:NAD(P)H-dependent flavin oxidoreductase n=1 Tax=Nocardia TaxID=1817 RepID=UPI0013590976|nr:MULTISPECIES: nitronate monooxygenase [Nocardia]MBF6168897.1 nitronate monooxygenase [Streptomyces gardneri]MBF6205094.1 nitronate monooxygenase [Streptomyces gardneri]UAK35908.1 nitronate monooxygenase [Nocardia asteroides]